MSVTRRSIYWVITILLTLGVVELASKAILADVFCEDRPHFFQFDDKLGWRGIPNKKGILWTTGRENRFRVSLNSEGFRDDNFEMQRTPGVTRVAMVGDSFIWGYGVQQDETIPSRLEQCLSNVEVYNFGINGYSTDQQYLLIRAIALRYQPAVIVLSVSHNDLHSNMHPSNIYSSVYSKPMFRVVERDQGEYGLKLVSVPDVGNRHRIVGGSRSKRTGLRRSALYRLVCEVIGFCRLVLNPPDSLHDFPQLTLTREARSSQLLYVLFREILSEIKNLCDREDVRLIMMLVTDYRQIHQNKIDKIVKRKGYLPKDFDLTAPNKRLAAIGENMDIAVVDLYPAIMEMEKSGNSAHYDVDVHYNALGTQKAAEILARCLSS